MDKQRETGALLIAACIVAAIRLRGEPIRPSPKLTATIAESVALTQLLTRDDIEVKGTRIRVRRTSASHLRCVSFDISGHRYEAIEQNPEKPSRWGQLARDGHQVVQFKDAGTNRFVAVAVDGKVHVYGAART